MPRCEAPFPRALGRYVREQKRLSLEEAIAKMTSRSAARIGLTDRGLVAAGNVADLVVFDPEAIVDHGTPRNPSQPPAGMRYVVVNGAFVLRDGQPTGARPERTLRRNDTSGSSPGLGRVSERFGMSWQPKFP